MKLFSMPISPKRNIVDRIHETEMRCTNFKKAPSENILPQCAMTYPTLEILSIPAFVCPLNYEHQVLLSFAKSIYNRGRAHPKNPEWIQQIHWELVLLNIVSSHSLEQVASLKDKGQSW